MLLVGLKSQVTVLEWGPSIYSDISTGKVVMVTAPGNGVTIIMTSQENKYLGSTLLNL